MPTEQKKDETRNLSWKNTLFGVIEELYRSDFQDLAKDLFKSSALYDAASSLHEDSQQSKQIFENKGQASRRRNKGQSLTWKTIFGSLARFGVQPADFRHIRTGNHVFLIGFAEAISKWSGTKESMGYRLEGPECTLVLYLMVFRQVDLGRAMAKYRSRDTDEVLKGRSELSQLAEQMNALMTKWWKIETPRITTELLIAYCTPGTLVGDEPRAEQNRSWFRCCAETLNDSAELNDWLDKALEDELSD